MKEKILIFTIALSMFSGICLSQDLRLRVQDISGEALPGAVIQMTGSDSVRIIRSADYSGVVSLNRIKPGDYPVRVSFVGFRNIDTVISVTSVKRDFLFVMMEDNLVMNEIVVTATRPLIRQEEDKMVIDIDMMASISTNTLEILESTPGLIVDQEGGIFLTSATPAMIFINGREQRMSSQDIMTILRSLPPGSVQRIEVIRTPSAKFSASSSGGIVNIVLKKGVRIGRFGSLRTGFNQGIRGNRFAGFSFNNSGDKSTAYVNAELSRNDMHEELVSARQLKPDTILNQSSETRRTANQGFAGYGISYDLSRRLNLSFDGRINGSLPRSAGNNLNRIVTPDDIILSETSNITRNESSFISIRQEAGALWRIDTTGSELDTRISFSHNRNRSRQNYGTDYINPSFPGTSGKGNNSQTGYFLQLQSDLAYMMPLMIKLETGLNLAYQDYRSSNEYFITTGGGMIPDPGRTGRYEYNENINSGYLQFSRELLWKILIKSGIRMEHTYMKGIQRIPSDTSFNVNRADWFPYLYLSRPVLTLAGFELRAFAIYRRTITRPGYESLNPAIRYVDQFFYETGNPSLKPQFTSNAEINLSIDDMPVFALGRSKTGNIFSSVIYRDAGDVNTAYRTFDNLGTSRETYFRITGGIPPIGGYFFYAGAQYNRNEYYGFYDGKELSYDRGSWRLFTHHALRVTKTTRISLNGFVMTKGQMNLYEMETFGQLNLGLRQTFLNDKLSVSFSARDILRTMGNEFTLNQGSISTRGTRYSDTRRFGVNVSYNFGIQGKKEKDKQPLFEDVD